jgi:hypothetical protein
MSSGELYNMEKAHVDRVTVKLSIDGSINPRLNFNTKL